MSYEPTLRQRTVGNFWAGEWRVVPNGSVWHFFGLDRTAACQRKVALNEAISGSPSDEDDLFAPKSPGQCRRCSMRVSNIRRWGKSESLQR